MSEPPARKDLEALARWVDEDNQATFISLYADLTDPKHRTLLERRRDEVTAVLAEDRLEAFEAAVDAALEELGPAKGQQARGVAVFGSPETDRWTSFRLAEPVTTRLVWDTSPYVRPLARFVDDYESIAIVLLDGDRATIHHVEAADPRQVFSDRANLASRHKKGGWSQMRYQRTRETELNRFLDGVVERLDQLAQGQGIRQVIIAGQGSVKDRLVNRLSPRLLERLTAVETVELDAVDEPALLRRLTDLGRLREDEDSRRAVSTVLEQLQRGELATADPFEVARAARDGRVELLVVDEGSHPGASKCEIHDTVFEHGATCACGDAGTEVDLANEAVEDATRSDARVEFVEDDRLREIGGLAALLRW